MEIATIAVLCGASIATAMVSAVLGMAGGIMLLAVMLLFLEPFAAIPIHAIVQLASNSSRTVIHARSIRRDLLFPFVLLLLPAGALTVSLVQSAPADALRLAIGIFCIVATWWPRWLLLGLDPERIPIVSRFAIVGGIAGAIGPVVGATGPFIAPFFLGLDLTRFELIGSKAACQAAGHLAKMMLFGIAGFAYLDYAPLMAGMVASVILGTWIGTRFLERIDDARFTQLYKATLTLVAIRLIATGAFEIAGRG